MAAGPTTVAPALEQRFVDTGAVGITPDPQAWAAQDDYVHASGALADVVLAREPWLDPEALAEVDAQWRTYVDRMVSYGYDGVVVPGFLEYVTFEGVEDGDAVSGRAEPVVPAQPVATTRQAEIMSARPRTLIRRVAGGTAASEDARGRLPP